MTTTTTETKSTTISLRANGSILRLIALRRGERAVTFVTMIDEATKKPTRGMSAEHTSFAEATATLVKLAEDAAKRGWQRSTPGRMFVRKADAFNAIPQAPKGKK